MSATDEHPACLNTRRFGRCRLYPAREGMKCGLCGEPLDLMIEFLSYQNPADRAEGQWYVGALCPACVTWIDQRPWAALYHPRDSLFVAGLGTALVGG